MKTAAGHGICVPEGERGAMTVSTTAAAAHERARQDTSNPSSENSMPTAEEQQRHAISASCSIVSAA